MRQLSWTHILQVLSLKDNLQCIKGMGILINGNSNHRLRNQSELVVWMLNFNCDTTSVAIFLLYSMGTSPIIKLSLLCHDNYDGLILWKLESKTPPLRSRKNSIITIQRKSFTNIIHNFAHNLHLLVDFPIVF